MIITPKWMHLAFDLPIKGGVGYALGSAAHVNKTLSASILAIASLADHILFYVANRWVRPSINQISYSSIQLSPAGLYLGTHLLVSTISLFAAKQLELISRQTLAMTLFAFSAIFFVRLSFLRSN